MENNGLKIAILTAHDPAADQPNVAERALSGISPGALPPGTFILENSGTLLKALEAATGFDGLILIDGASMGMPPGGIKVFSLNELILPGSPPRVEFDNVDIQGDILYANKFLSLPPVRIVGIESGRGPAGGNTGISGYEPAGFVGACLEAIRRAAGELTT